MNPKRIDPDSPEGLGSTYHSQADSLCLTDNKWNWKCESCGKVYLNRWKAKECCGEVDKTRKCPNCGHPFKYDKVLHGQLGFKHECSECKTSFKVEKQ